MDIWIKDRYQDTNFIYLFRYIAENVQPADGWTTFDLHVNVGMYHGNTGE